MRLLISFKPVDSKSDMVSRTCKKKKTQGWHTDADADVCLNVVQPAHHGVPRTRAGVSVMELGVSASSIQKKAIAHVDQPSID